VEVTFTVAPAVRRTRFHCGWAAAKQSGKLELGPDFLRLFFSPSAKMSADMLVWATSNMRDAIAVGREPVTIEREVDDEHQWSIISPSMHAVADVSVAESGSSEVTFEIMGGYIVPERAVLRPGRVKLTIINRSEDSELLAGLAKFEKDDAPDPDARGEEEAEDDGEPWMVWQPMLSGKKLLSTQSFRELFRTETLAPDASLELQSLAILFSDLKASTQLYERVGDLKALELVREHFKILRDVVDEEEGAIVKTIGDAVMATFVDPAHAVRAGARMHRAIKRLANAEEPSLKIGVHTGACVAIDSNERLDYFGTTVNIAARVQGIAEAREIVCTDAVLASPGVRGALAAMSIDLTRVEARLKGIEHPVIVHRGIVA
jgi:class 3 adenylate cyclase